MTSPTQDSHGKPGWTARLSNRLKRASLGSTSKSTTPQEDDLHDTREGRDPEGEIIGLDMKGKARRSSTTSTQPRTPKSPSSVYSTTHSLEPQTISSPVSARGGLTQADNGQQLGNYDSPRESNIGNTQRTHSRESSLDHSTTSAGQSSTIRRKEIPVDNTMSSLGSPGRAGHKHDSRLSQDASDGGISGGNETGLPIASEFLNRQAPPDKRSSLDAAREILGGHNSTVQTHPGGHNSVSDNHHPTAEEIVARSKYNSSDTTYHEKMAPAVTHERVDKQVHNITQEHITRDVHHYHHVHRILPIHEVEVLPAKHYRIVDNQKVEMKPEEVPQSRVDAWESAVVPKIEGSRT